MYEKKLKAIPINKLIRIINRLSQAQVRTNIAAILKYCSEIYLMYLSFKIFQT